MAKERGTRRARGATAATASHAEAARPSSGPPSGPSSERWERLTLAALCVVAIALRATRLSTLSVEHFDEGVYASNLWFSADQGFQYPLRYLYAPPLLPTLIEWLLILGGSFQSAPFFPGIVAGCATIPLIWILARHWFGPRAALLAATWAAGSDLHALFTRTALTDPLLLVFVLGAVYCGARALRSGQLPWIAAAGLFTGLAWWTKYNGWLPLAILGAGLTLEGIACRWSLAQWRRQILCWLAIGVLAVGVWSPVWYGLQDYGGYSVVAANHGKYVVGLSGWWTSVETLVEQMRQCDSELVLLAVPVGAAVVCLVCRGCSDKPDEPSSAGSIGRIVAATLAIVAVGVFCGSVAVLLAVSLVGMASFAGELVRRRSSSVTERPDPEYDEDARQRRTQGRAMTTAWVIGLLVATPCYYPYLRLTLPGLAGLWLTAAWSIDLLLGLKVVSESDPKFRGVSLLRRIVLTLAIGASVTAMAFVASSPKRLRQLWPPAVAASRRGLADATEKLRDNPAARARSANTPRVFFVYGEPAVVYQLRAAGEELVLPIGDLNLNQLPAATAADLFLMVGPHAREDRQFADEWQQRGARFEQIASERFRPSPVLRLDQNAARRDGGDEVESFELTLYRLKREQP